MSDPIGQIDPRLQAPRVVTRTVPGGPGAAGGPVAGADGPASFSQVLGETLRKAAGGDLKFSAHALDRLRDRNIHLTGADLEQMRDAVDRAAAKGSKESLLVKSDLAFVVNVPNRTVITALSGHLMKDHVFTNIDSAVLLK